jgi:dienelactone hydrolase
MSTRTDVVRDVAIPVGAATLEGEMVLPPGARGLVLFAHGSGSSRHSPRNHLVARAIRETGCGTLLFDLLTAQEEAVDLRTRQLRFDIDLLAGRLAEATEWARRERDARHLPIGYFGASTGGAAALIAAAELADAVAAIVLRGGRPDLAGEALGQVRAPTLLIVGGRDETVVELNERAFAALRCDKQLKIVPGATHLFEEPGALERVAELSARWFSQRLGAGPG